MPIDTNRVDNGASASNGALADAIRIWHQGDYLTPEQVDMIELARMETYARALGVQF